MGKLGTLTHQTKTSRLKLPKILALHIPLSPQNRRGGPLLPLRDSIVPWWEDSDVCFFFQGNTLPPQDLPLPLFLTTGLITWVKLQQNPIRDMLIREEMEL